MDGGADLTGAVIDGRYRIEEVLGRGAMGVVYRARHVQLDHEVAVKVLDPKHSQQAETLERLRREARAASSIGHSGIVRVFDMGSLADGSLYVVMELHRGESLRAVLDREGNLDAARTVSIATQVCDAMAAAHAQHIYHRDIKPENLLVDQRGRVTVIDFGVAKLVDATVVLTQTHQILGTPIYMAPEQWHGADIDGRVDVYALGVVLYEMLTGRPPFLAESLGALIAAHLSEHPVPPHRRLSSVPPALSALVCACLAKERDDRPSSMSALRAALVEAGDAHAAVAFDATLAALPATFAQAAWQDTLSAPTLGAAGTATPPAGTVIPAPTPVWGHAYEHSPNVPTDESGSFEGRLPGARRWGLALLLLGPLALAVSGFLVYLALSVVSSSDEVRPPDDPFAVPPGAVSVGQTSATAVQGDASATDAGVHPIDAGVRAAVSRPRTPRAPLNARPAPSTGPATMTDPSPPARPSHPDISDPWR